MKQESNLTERGLDGRKRRREEIDIIVGLGAYIIMPDNVLQP
jgi:hypothetical protein